MKHVHTFENFLNEARKIEDYKGLKIGTKYGNLGKILELGFRATKDEPAKEGDLVWSHHNGLLYRLPYALKAEDIRRGELSKIVDESAVNEIVGVKPTDAGKAAHWINGEYEKDGFDNEAFGYALKGFFKDEYPSEKLQSEILDLLRAKYNFEFEPSKSALIISQRMY
jgi:hypothetical protein